MSRGNERMDENRQDTPSSIPPESPEATGESPTGSQIHGSARERPRSVEPMDPHEAAETPSSGLHDAKRALSGNKQRESGRANEAATSDEIPDEELKRPNPHFKP